VLAYLTTGSINCIFWVATVSHLLQDGYEVSSQSNHWQAEDRDFSTFGL